MRRLFGQSFNQFVKAFRLNWFRQIVVHPRFQTAFAVALHGVGRHGEDGNVPACRPVFDTFLAEALPGVRDSRSSESVSNGSVVHFLTRLGETPYESVSLLTAIRSQRPADHIGQPAASDPAVSPSRSRIGWDVFGRANAALAPDVLTSTLNCQPGERLMTIHRKTIALAATLAFLSALSGDATAQRRSVRRDSHGRSHAARGADRKTRTAGLPGSTRET